MFWHPLTSVLFHPARSVIFLSSGVELRAGSVSFISVLALACTVKVVLHLMKGVSAFILDVFGHTTNVVRLPVIVEALAFPIKIRIGNGKNKNLEPVISQWSNNRFTGV
jgi:hypothetical protein